MSKTNTKAITQINTKAKINPFFIQVGWVQLLAGFDEICRENHFRVSRSLFCKFLIFDFFLKKYNSNNTGLYLEYKVIILINLRLF